MTINYGKRMLATTAAAILIGQGTPAVAVLSHTAPERAALQEYWHDQQVLDYISVRSRVAQLQRPPSAGSPHKKLPDVIVYIPAAGTPERDAYDNKIFGFLVTEASLEDKLKQSAPPVVGWLGSTILGYAIAMGYWMRRNDEQSHKILGEEFGNSVIGYLGIDPDMFQRRRKNVRD